MQDLAAKIKAILLRSDLQTVTAKQVRKELQLICGPNEQTVIVQDKAKIDAMTVEILTKIIEEKASAESKTASPTRNVKSLLPKTRKKRSATEGPLSDDIVNLEDADDIAGDPTANDEAYARFLQRSLANRRETRNGQSEQPAKVKEKRKRKTPVYQNSLEYSSELEAVVGKGHCTRFQITSKLWEYIKANGLQDPSDKRFILCDKQLQAVMGKERINMLHMPKEITRHIFHNADIVIAKKVKSTGSDSEPRKNGGLTQPLVLSDALAKLVKASTLARTQVVKELWRYIKEHDLQDPEDKRYILCDGALMAVMDNRERVSAFKMNKYISKHMWKSGEKADDTANSSSRIETDLTSDKSDTESGDANDSTSASTSESRLATTES